MLARWDPGAPARRRTRLLARLLTRYLAAELAARTRKEIRDAAPAPVQADPARHPL
jgi:hypothetical protein